MNTVTILAAGLVVGSRPSRWCELGGLRSWSGGFDAENGVCLLVVDPCEGLDHHVTAGGEWKSSAHRTDQQGR